MNGQNARAILKYPGAKWRLADWIIRNMPDHKSYLEPFFGSGAVFFSKPPSRIETINDIDCDIVNLFRCVREDAERLCRLVDATPYSRREYLDCFTREDTEPFERARTYLIKCWQGHGFRVAYRSGWKNDVSGREYAYAVKYWNELPDWIQGIVRRLKQAQVECSPARELIQRFHSPAVLIYADPPYLLSTRKNKRAYAHEMTVDDHAELIATLKQHPGPVMLSGYENDLYNDLLEGWRKIQIATTAEKGKHRIETLWMNYDLPPLTGGYI